MDITCSSIMTPVGNLTCFEDNEKIIVLEWGQGLKGIETPLLKEAKSQLSAYFSGKLTKFDLPLAPDGTAHQQNVWKIMAQIPYAQTLTYERLPTKSVLHLALLAGPVVKTRSRLLFLVTGLSEQMVNSPAFQAEKAWKPKPNSCVWKKPSPNQQHNK